MTTTILIVEDDPHLRMGLADLLSLEGYACRTAVNGEAALAEVATKAPDLIILDLMMPGMDGLTVCKNIRRADALTPILMLTARGDEIDRVIGLESGADDYITKPFGPRELLARVRAALRRANPFPLSDPTCRPLGADNFALGELAVDARALKARRGDGKVVDLTLRELAILKLLRDRPGEAISRDEMFDACWGRDYMPNSRALDQQISVLRRKIEQDPATPRVIRTVHGVGYRHDPA